VPPATRGEKRMESFAKLDAKARRARVRTSTAIFAGVP
jgi:hypothetical protein